MGTRGRILSISIGVSAIIALTGLLLWQPIWEPTRKSTGHSQHPIADIPRHPGTIQNTGETPVVPEVPAPDAEPSGVAGAKEGSPKPELRVHGVVSDAVGRPMPGVLVGHASFSGWTTTDQLGRYALLLDLQQRESFILRFLRTGFDEVNAAVRSAEHQAGSSLQLSVTMTPGTNNVSVSGRVYGTGNLGIAGQRVRLFSSGLARQYLAETGRDGSFVLQGVRTGKYNLTVFADERYMRATLTDIEIAADAELDVYLQEIETGSLQGEFLDSEGTPLASLTLDAYSDSQPERPIRITTDEYGRFELKNAANGRWTFQTRRNGFFRVSDVPHDPYVSSDPRLILDIGPFSVSGWIHDRASAPVQNARVEFTRQEKQPFFRRSSRRVLNVDASGWFEATGLALGAYEIRVFAKGFIPKSLKYEAGHRGDHPTIRLDRFPGVD